MPAEPFFLAGNSPRPEPIQNLGYSKWLSSPTLRHSRAFPGASDPLPVLAVCVAAGFFGGEVVEVAPPFDPSGNTALVGATMMFEILCVVAQSRFAQL